MSITTSIFLWAFWAASVTLTGMFLAFGFSLGKWVIEKIKKFFSFRKGLTSDTVKQFITEQQQVTETIMT